LNIWITGCSGFLGTRLAGQLAANQHQITGLSRRSCAAATRSVSINLASPKSPATLHQLAQDSGTPDVVIHAASKQPGDGDLPAFVDANVRSTSNLMEGLAQLPPRLIIYTSTLSVYGRPSLLPVAEASPAGGGLPYGATKRWGEQLLETFQRYSKGRKTVLLTDWLGLLDATTRSSCFHVAKQFAMRCTLVMSSRQLTTASHGRPRISFQCSISVAANR